jgi:transcriptional repressor NF-X1
LAEALGITPAKNTNTSPAGTSGGYASLVNTAIYSEEVTGFARVNPRFLALVEKAFADFVSSGKKVQVLPHMPPERRKFVHDVSGFLDI